MISSNVLTFGGLKVNTRAQVLVLDQDSVPMRGLYAAGAVVGFYYKTYIGATSVLKGRCLGGWLEWIRRKLPKYLFLKE